MASLLAKYSSQTASTFHYIFVDYRICVSSHPYDSPTAVDSFWYRVLDGTARMYQIFTAKVKTGVYGAIFGLV